MHPENPSATSALPRARIFVSSPGDVRAERDIVQRVLQNLQVDLASRLKIEVFLWENEPFFVEQDYQGQITSPAEFDLFLCILWSRFGTPLHPEKYKRADGSTYLSGTEYEFESAIEAFRQNNGTPRIMVFHKLKEPYIPPRPKDKRDECIAQYDAVQTFLDKWTKDPVFDGVYSAAINTYEDEFDFEGRLASYLRSFLQGFLENQPGQAENITWHENPYRGLEHFDFEHAPIFHGREVVTREIFTLLTEQFEAKKPFLMVSGSSGVGKSSVVRAGLLPLLLQSREVWHTSEWRYAELRPSDKEPEEEDFAGALARALTQQRDISMVKQDGPQARLVAPSALPELLSGNVGIEELSNRIRKDMGAVIGRIELCLENITRKIHKTEDVNGRPGVRLCLLLDQLEEFFTNPATTHESRKQFFANLRTLVETGFVVVVATMRIDCMGFCEEQEDLQYLKSGKGYFHLSPPSKDDIARIIRLPARAAGVSFETNEHGDMLDDCIRDAVISYDALEQGTTALPLLEFTLSELYEKAKEGTGIPCLRFAHYEEMGGLKGAVASKADEAFKEFAKTCTDAEAVFGKVMRHLVTASQDSVLGRQKAANALFAPQTNERALVDALIEARLLVIGHDETHDETQGENAHKDVVYVWIAHEALLRHWEKLTHWLETEREHFAIRQRLKADLSLWQEEHAKDKGAHTDLLLPAGKPLQDAEALRDHYDNVLQDDEKQFIAASRKFANRKRQRLYMLLVALAVGFVLALVGGGIAWRMSEKAVLARNDAETLINYMLVDLRDKLQPLGRLSLLGDVYKELEAYYNRQGDEEITLDIQRQQAALLQQQGDVLRGQGQTEEALKLYQESLKLRRALAERAGNTMQGQDDVAVSLEGIGDILVSQGKPEEALKLYQESSSIWRALMKHDPNNTGWQRGVTIPLERMGDILTRQGKIGEALEYYQESLDIARTLVAKESDNSLWQRDVSISLEKIGDILASQGKVEQALEPYQEGLKIRRILAEKEPENPGWQRDVAVSLERVGDVLASQGKADDALKQYEESLGIWRILAAHDPSNTAWQRGVSIPLNRIGEALAKKGQADKALPYYQECLEIRLVLAEKDPENVQGQRDLIVSYYQLARLLERTDTQTALGYLDSALAVMDALVQKDPSNEHYKKELDFLQKYKILIEP